MTLRRLDLELVARGLVRSRQAGQQAIREGNVRVDGVVLEKPSAEIACGARIEIAAGPRFVSRGGEKLEHALLRLAIDVARRTCADVGASTGGFTDCMLQRGAARVLAIDVGHDQLDARLRADPRVVVREGLNARAAHDLGERVSFVAIDVSFISLARILPVVRGWFDPALDPQAVALVKPQFEAGRGAVGRGGIVRDRRVHQRVLLEVVAAARAAGFGALGLVPSPITGGDGNIEFLLHLRPAQSTLGALALQDAALADAALGELGPLDRGRSDR